MQAHFREWTAPRALSPGVAVAVVAPAGPVPAPRLAAGLALVSARYEVLSAPGLLARDGYLAGDDGRRLAELRWALSDPRVRGVLCARGGYGTLRYLPELLAASRDAASRPPLLSGFSDITVLLQWLALQRVRSVHGPVLTQIGDLPLADGEDLLALLEGQVPPPLTDLIPLRRGHARGRLLGGNLEVLSRLCGTPLQEALRPGEPVLLLLEEVGERPYRVDRALTQLLLSGALRDVVGVVVGDLVRCEEPGGQGPSALEVVRERLFALPGFQGPVVVGAPIGHGSRNRPVPHGALAELHHGTLRFLEGATLC